MSNAAILLDPFARGIAVGAMAAISLGVWRSRVSRQARLVTTALGLSTIAWLITESWPLWGAFGHANLLVAAAYPVGGFFWLFIATVFDDRPLGPSMLTPPALLLALGLVMGAAPPSALSVYWMLFNGASGLFVLHAGFIVLRGWRDDLVEGRRQLRVLILGLVALFAITQVVMSFLARLDPLGPWRLFTISAPYGGSVLAALILATSTLFLQVRPVAFGGSRRGEPQPDPRVEAVDRLLVGKLDEFLTAEGWRREGLTIGGLAIELEVPEHRLRRLINNRLGHRNFADFLNASRIAAAKQRLADPREARTTVAAIAFDLGYGSLGPFNRAFRAATGSNPTEWRRGALGAPPNLRDSG